MGFYTYFVYGYFLLIQRLLLEQRGVGSQAGYSSRFDTQLAGAGRLR